MKKCIVICVLVTSLLFFQSNVKRITSSNFPPTNCTGAPNAYTCQFCHSTYSANISGGGIGLTGIPSTFSIGQSYPFSINIKHFAADRKKFGYDVTALDALGNPFGTFSTTNAYSTINSGELTSHLPPYLTPTNQSSISGFTWNAPATAPSANQLPITFYFCGNACNGDGTVKGDYIYNDSVATTLGALPVAINHFVVTWKSDNEVQLNWSFGNESLLNFYVIQRSVDGADLLNIDSILVNKGSLVNNNYSYTDRKVLGNERIAYRIKSIAKDGSVSYSSIQVLPYTIQVANARLYPNPVARNNPLKLSFSSNQKQLCNVSVISTAGRLFFATKQEVVLGNNTLSITTGQNIPVGTYFLVVSSVNTILAKQAFMIK